MSCRFIVPGRLLLMITAVGLVLGVQWFLAEQARAEKPKDEPVQANVPAVLDFEVDTIQDEKIRLDQYHGDVVLIVNVASKCGLTPQYEQLQKLHEEYAEKGLSVLGFPANNFGKQEPGSNEEIATFCDKNYGVEFDMFAKVAVAGDDQAPLYKFLTSEETNPKFAGEIEWNFDKFLVSREGRVIARFSPRTKPSTKEVVETIEDALSQPVPDAVKAKRQAAKEAADAKESGAGE